MTEKNHPSTMNCVAAARTIKIALIYGRTPVPMRRADQMTVAHLLAFLKKRGHEVDLFYVDTGADASEDDLRWLASVTRKIYRFKQNPLSLLRGLSGVIFRLLPVQVALFSHSGQKRAVRDAVSSEKYDIVYTYYFRSAEVTRWLHAGANAQNMPPSILAMQLSQSLNADRISRNAPDALLRWFYAVESRLVARYEARIWRDFTRSALIGHSDVEAIKAACRRWGQPEIDNWFYSAHGTNVARFKPAPDEEGTPNHLVFSGVMRTPTNVQAVQWFAEKVWPKILAVQPNATWSIVGREPVAEVISLGRLPGVTVTGTVDDPAAYMRSAAVCINPMQAGGGMQNKLIEYLATGKPIVATSVANEGIQAPPEALMLADSPDDFAASVLELLENRDKARALGKAARDYALANWTWEAHFLKLEQEMLSLVSDQ